jgi:Spy/CpxP family protein refolding chaperone
MKNRLLIASLVLVLFAAALLSAQPAFRGMREGRGRRMQAVFAGENFIPVRLVLKAKDKIGLGAEQEKKLIAMDEAHEQWLIKFRADMEIKAMKLRAVLEAEPLNMKDAEGMIRAQAGMHADMMIARLQFQQEVKSVLTAEQLLKLNELKKEFRDRAREGLRERRQERRERLD